MSKKIINSLRTKPMQDYYDAQQRLLTIVQKNFGKGRSDGAEWRRWLRDRNVRAPSKPVSRQTLRAQLRKEHYRRSYIVGDHHRFPENLQPLPRRDRRALARAHAARDFREIRSAK